MRQAKVGPATGLQEQLGADVEMALAAFHRSPARQVHHQAARQGALQEVAQLLAHGHRILVGGWSLWGAAEGGCG